MDAEAVNRLSDAPAFPLLSTGPIWLLLVLLLFLGGWWWWRQRQAGGLRAAGELSIQILATRPLGPRSHLAIVEAAGQRSLIATTAQGVHYLRDLPAAGAGASFASHLPPASPESPSSDPA